MTDRATTSQREYLARILMRQGYTPQKRTSADRTGPQWRPVFQLADIPEPKPFDWPTVDEFVSNLTVVQASQIINRLLERES